MEPIVSNPPVATIYRCEHGGIHLVCQNVNIGMPPGEFRDLNREVQRARSLVDAGLLTCSYLSLAYGTTVICLSARALPALAEAMQEAAEAIEESLQPGQGPSPEGACPPRGARLQVFSGPRVQPQQMHNLN
ncbi:MAG: hypothetical protein OXG13_14770 [Gemmatimonadaceae bacterium]|nr:hypothetical protein [Gemmatimonadaceae bacterium]